MVIKLTNGNIITLNDDNFISFESIGYSLSYVTYFDEEICKERVPISVHQLTKQLRKERNENVYN